MSLTTRDNGVCEAYISCGRTDPRSALPAMALPLPLVLGLLALMVASVAYGHGGPPAACPHPVVAFLLLGLGLLTLPLGVGAVALGHRPAGALAVCLAVLLFSCAAHLLRAPGPEGGDGTKDPPGGPPSGLDGLRIDWDAFDRARESWARSLAGRR